MDVVPLNRRKPIHPLLKSLIWPSPIDYQKGEIGTKNGGSSEMLGLHRVQYLAHTEMLSRG